VAFRRLIEIDIYGSTSKEFARGFRNPQGMFVDRTGLVWATEHGPEGGDELNVVGQGDHLGWPQATYGTDYGDKSWALDMSAGRHENFKKPIFSWIPSVAPSQLTEVTVGWPEWEGGLLIGTLRLESLLRTRLEGSSVKYIEEIEIGARIRDVVLDSTGRIWLWTDNSNLVRLERHKSNNERIRDVPDCLSCHSLDKKITSRGPSLETFVSEGFVSDADFSYSQGMLTLKGTTLTADEVVAFAKNPGSFVPDSSMPPSLMTENGIRDFYDKMVEADKSAVKFEP